MLSFKIEGLERISKTFEQMHSDLQHFGKVTLKQEMDTWQTQDMHRHRPFTMQWSRQHKVQTVIRPHSLYEVLGRRRYVRRVYKQAIKFGFMQPPPRKRRTHRVYSKTSTRPILRSSLEQRLMDRMRTALAAIRWR